MDIKTKRIGALLMGLAVIGMLAAPLAMATSSDGKLATIICSKGCSGADDLTCDIACNLGLYTQGAKYGWISEQTVKELFKKSIYRGIYGGAAFILVGAGITV